MIRKRFWRTVPSINRWIIHVVRRGHIVLTKKKIEEKEYCVKEEEEEKQRAKETLEDHCEKKLLNMDNEHI